MAAQGGGGHPGNNVGGRPNAGWHSLDNDRDRNKRYRMSAELATLGADFLVLNDAGEHEFRFSGRAISDNDTIRVEDMQGRMLFEAVVHAARRQARIAIVNCAGTEFGSVVRKPVSPLRDRFTIELVDGVTLAVDGNLSRHEYSIVGVPGQVAEISGKWFRARGSYGVEVMPGQQDAFLLATTVVMDQMIHGTA